MEDGTQEDCRGVAAGRDVGRGPNEKGSAMPCQRA